MRLHPIKTTEHLRDKYIRYLKTIYTFQDPWLRKQFSEAIKRPEALVKGPILEASPPFVKTKSIKDLVENRILSPGFKSLCSDHLPYQRPLYQHQESAIQKVVQGRNIVVSTGTGSGKTESFIIPILNHLLIEEEKGTLSRPGIRALLLYPLNALANDQVKRLRRVLLDYPQITFGRYIGETERKHEQAEEQFQKIYPEEPRIANELLSRDKMQANPPHIFLTNYAMLEYLLLRPADSVFFDGQTGKHWSFIVLDEAHIYDGAQANEIGMLMRRLEQRIVGGQLTRLQGIATSATIGGGEQDFPEVVKFAQGLFNLPFEWHQDDPEKQDVVGASRLPVSSLGDTWGRGTPQLYRGLAQMADLFRESRSFNPPESSVFGEVPPDVMNRLNGISDSPEYLHVLLKGDRNLHLVREELEKEPCDLKDLAQTIFPEYPPEIAENAVTDLVSAAVLAKEGSDELPLLPARYHVFAKALEGAFICLNSNAHKVDGGEDLPNLFLTRQKKCPLCGSQVFELANCTLCGKAYLIGTLKEHPGGLRTLEQNSVVYDAIVTEREVSYFVFDLPAIVALDEDSSVDLDATSSVEDPDEDLEPMILCPECGSVRGEFELDRCGCKIEPLRVSRIDLRRKSTLQRCVNCSTRSNRGVVYRFLTGQDPPVSVLVDALYQHLPESTDAHIADFPGKGRKLLNFTDSRQKAAFFAPFVERTHMRDLRRQIIIQTLLTDPEAVSAQLRLPDLVTRIVHQSERKGVFHENLSNDARKREVSIWLMKEFSPLARRISLEGVGLLRFDPVIDPGWIMPDFLIEDPWNFTKSEAESVILLLLKSLRINGAVTYLRSEIENLVADEKFAPRNKIIYFRGYKASQTRSYNIVSWNPADGYSNSRLDILRRYLLIKGLPEDEANDLAFLLLKKLWEYLPSEYSPWGKLFLKSDLDSEGVVFQIRHEMWKAIPSGSEDWEGWYICDRCMNLSPYHAGGVCGTFGCQGSLLPLDENRDLLQENIYRDTYVNGEPIPLSAEEHTAQWVTRKAAEVQNRFIRGEINLLSCSTTFELGVDVGDLQSVVMRNVPPTTANYVQRAGRAGRRTDSAALSLTFAQRRPHDLTHFQNPKGMVSGEIKPPVSVLNNEKIVRRHLYSVVFAAFLRWAKDNFSLDFFTIGSFFEGRQNDKSGAALFREFIAKKDPNLLIALQQILPDDERFVDIFSLESWGWLHEFINDENSGVFDQAELEYHHEILEFQELLNEAVAESKFHLADRYQKIQKQIRNRELFGYLANRNVLPKYGFPTDVVTLKTDHLQTIPQASQIDLSRDLRMAISEFAPGSQVIAAKRIWHSAGIRKYPNQHWEPYQYAVCPECNRMIIEVGETPPATCLCGHVFQSSGFHGVYIVPEHGFVAAQKTTSPGEKTPEVYYSSQVYFANYDFSKNPGNKGELELEIDQQFATKKFPVRKKYSRNGTLAIVNNGRGRGFNICDHCGYTEPAIQNKKWGEHENPLTGGKCKGGYTRYHFGHRFMTDVLEFQIEHAFNQNSSEVNSLLHAVLVGASTALGIKRDDLSGTYYYKNREPAFIIYDNVPGGAGHVARVADHLFEVFQSALATVSNCECGEDTSCYRCLRNYRNQNVHDDLDRGLAAKILAGAIEEE